MAQENKSISVLPAQEQAQIDLWADFGWDLKSSQEIFNRDSHLEGRSSGTYSVTTTTNYVKLVFTRDTNMKNYNEIAAIEREFDSLHEHKIPGPNLNGKWILSFLFFGIGLVLFILLKLINMKKKKDAIAHNSMVRRKRAELRQKARALLS